LPLYEALLFDDSGEDPLLLAERLQPLVMMVMLLWPDRPQPLVMMFLLPLVMMSMLL